MTALALASTLPRLGESQPLAVNDARPLVYSFDLPFPPSVNTLFPGDGKHRWPSKKYKAWRAEAGPQVPTGRIDGKYAMWVRLDRPDRRARDCANYEKALSDLLVSQGLVEDDSLCARLILEWASDEPTKDARAHIDVVSGVNLEPLTFTWRPS